MVDKFILSHYYLSTKSLKECNYFDSSQRPKLVSDEVHHFDEISLRYAVAYCMAHILENEWNEFRDEWNSHKIHENSKTLLPSGIPNDLYDLPQTFGL